jgi:hypothetical protein
VYLTLIDEAGQVVQEERLDVVNPRTWQPWAAGSPDSLLTHSISGSMALSLAAGAYKVGLWMPDSFESLKYTPAYCIKLATDNGAVAHWTDANHTRTVNIVGEVRVAEKLEPEKPSAAFATPAKNIKVYARNGYIRVDGTDSPPMVYNLMGAAVSASSRLPAGIYIVKVEGAVFKVIVN